MEAQHDRAAAPASDSEALAKQLNEFRAYMDASFDRIDNRIDHLWGKHDFARVAGCPNCEARRAQ